MLFALFLIPIVVLQYRRVGGFSFSRYLVAAAASIYAVALISYTLLPLPDPDTLNCAASHTLLQLQPGASLDDIAQVVREQGRRAALTFFVLISAVFVLFTPSARGLSLRLTSGKVVDARADNDAPGT